MAPRCRTERLVMLALAVPVVALMATAAASAQTRPNLAGTWEVTGVTASGGGEGGGRADGGGGGRGFGGGFGGGGGRGGGRRGGGSGSGGPRGGGRRGGGGPAAQALHVGERLRFTVTESLVTIALDEANGGRVTRYPLDGTEGVTSGPDGGVIKTKTTWDGMALMTDSRAAEGGGKARDVRSVSADGLEMTVVTTLDTAGGKRSVTATLQRIEEP